MIDGYFENMKRERNKVMDEFRKLKKDILQCQKCQNIFDDPPHPIFQGQHNSLIMQIGQAPSKKVMMTGKPFNDASGKKLLCDWYQVSREQFDDPQNFYISSIGRCYPGKAITGDNPPVLQCADLFLKRELEIIKPQMYIIIGHYAAQYFFKDELLEELVFQDHTWQGKPLYVLPHPSPLNRKWLKDHPQFEKERTLEIREKIQTLIQK
jgi:uracil-DNA glycosylase family 4